MDAIPKELLNHSNENDTENQTPENAVNKQINLAWINIKVEA